MQKTESPPLTTLENSETRIPAINRPQVKFFKGAFITLKSVNMVDPLDIAKYSTRQNSILKIQGLVLFYTAFWAHLVDYGNFLKPNQTKIPFYLACVGLPTLVHAIYASTYMSEFLEKMDQRYAVQYDKYYLQTLTEKKEPI